MSIGCVLPLFLWVKNSREDCLDEEWASGGRI